MIQDLVSEIQNEFQYTATGQQQRHPAVRFIFGKNELSAPIADQQINWFVERESFNEDIDHIGANGLQVMVRQVTLSFEIFSKDMNKVEELMNDLIVATKYKVFSPSMSSIEGEWIDRGDIQQAGFGYRLDITVDMAIKKRPRPVVILTGIDTTTRFNESSETIDSSIP